MNYYTCDNSNSIAYNGNISAKDLWKDALIGTGIDIETGSISADKLYTSNIKSIWNTSDYDITINKEYIDEIARAVADLQKNEKITLDEGPEIPKWTGFLPI